MAATDDNRPNREVVALVLVGVCLIGAAAWTLPKVIVALGAAVGMIGGTVAVASNPWAAPVASVGLAAGGSALLILLLVKASREAQKEPYEWALPLVGLGGGAILDVAKEYAVQNVMLRVTLTIVMGYLVVVAGACYKSGKFLWRTVAILLILLPPATVLIHSLDQAERSQALVALNDVPDATWVRLGGFILVGLVVVALQYATTPRARSHG